MTQIIQPRGPVHLVIDRTGTLYLNNEESTVDGVDQAIGRIRADGGEPRAIISADERITHGEVAGLMDHLRLQRVFQIALNTKKQTIE